MTSVLAVEKEPERHSRQDRGWEEVFQGRKDICLFVLDLGMNLLGIAYIYHAKYFIKLSPIKIWYEVH